MLNVTELLVTLLSVVVGVATRANVVLLTSCAANDSILPEAVAFTFFNTNVVEGAKPGPALTVNVVPGCTEL